MTDRHLVYVEYTDEDGRPCIQVSRIASETEKTFMVVGIGAPYRVPKRGLRYRVIDGQKAADAFASEIIDRTARLRDDVRDKRLAYIRARRRLSEAVADALALDPLPAGGE